MREIKFRAWNGSEMRYKVNVNDGKPVRYWYQWFDDSNDIHDSELMQYTWLKDKNGKKIYECDYTSSGMMIDFYEWMFIPFYDWGNQERYEDVWCDWWSKCEIIGNKYENPTLPEEYDR